MRTIWMFLIFSLTAWLLGACGSSQGIPIAPAEDRLTFLFFYIDG